MNLRIQFVIFTALLFTGMNAALSQKINSYNFEELEPVLRFQSDTTYVVNFWAMWCKPCVEELPEFEEIRKAHSDQKVKVILVSLDFGSDVEERLLKFLERKDIHATTLLLDDPDANSWIGKVDEKWDGALPATLVYRKDQRKFYARKITFKEIAESIKQISNQTN